MEWETVIGLEVHVQLKTQSKLFSGSSTQFGAEPNTQACAIDLGYPGVLPVLNSEAVTLATRFGLAVNAEVTKRSVFARKNYFYPDLPKGYQISQYSLPIVAQGHLEISTADGNKRIGITRAHLEEDAGKSLHEGLPGFTGIDLNRAGTPLLEIVSEPDLRSAGDAVTYLKTLHALVRAIGISDANMQEGMFRCDVNISLRPKGQAYYGTRAEIKNVNSFRFVEQAILHEMERQQDILESGGKVVQETRQFDANKGITRSLRGKEEAHDYRYFPDPDLLPVILDDEFINNIKATLPELPQQKVTRFKQDYALNDYDANLLASDVDIAHYFETALKANDKVSAKLLANWLNGEVAAYLNKENLTILACPISPEALNQLLQHIENSTISSSIAKQVFAAMWNGEGSADEIIRKQGLQQINDSDALNAIIEKIIADNPSQVEQYRSGKDKLFGFFVGQVMKATQGKANPQQVNELLRSHLK